MSRNAPGGLRFLGQKTYVVPTFCAALNIRLYLIMSSNMKQNRPPSLSTLTIPVEQGEEEELIDCSLYNQSISGNVSIYFRNIEQRLVEHIKESDCVFGCVAWLTSEPILNAISEKSIAQLIIQKEDFLRPDIGSPSKFKPHLRTLYQRISGVYRAHFSSKIAVSRTWTMASEAELIDGVRCVGYRKQHHAEILPVMHHKFLVFCTYTESPHEEYPFGLINPYAVWTGSFNFTHNATCSFENAVFIEDPIVAKTYLTEWGQLAALSEPLDWEHEYVVPEYWIGSGT